MSTHKAQKALDAEVLAAIRKYAERPGWRVEGMSLEYGTRYINWDRAWMTFDGAVYARLRDAIHHVESL